MKRITAQVLVAAVVLLLGSIPDARAISHSTAFKAPLTSPYERCGEELSTTNCTANLDLVSPWTFDQGTVEIDDSEVSLRLDGLRLASGKECATDVGDLNACNCWNDQFGECVDDTDCSPPTSYCGPNADNTTDNNFFTVFIYLQDFAEAYGGDVIRRLTNCHPEIPFDIKNVSGDRNKTVNQTVSVSIESCGIASLAHGVEIRHVEVKDAYGNVVARAMH